ncbi:MAG TPA: hypothetical protein VGE93_17130 [Bryobacteraceae bacterium]
MTRLNASNENGIFVSAANLNWFGRNMEWDNPHIAGYIELQPGVDPAALRGPITQLVRSNANLAVAANLKVVPRRLSAWYLDSDGGAVRKMVSILAIIAVFILGMAVINFVNLAISRDRRWGSSPVDPTALAGWVCDTDRAHGLAVFDRNGRVGNADRSVDRRANSVGGDEQSYSKSQGELIGCGQFWR